MVRAALSIPPAPAGVVCHHVLSIETQGQTAFVDITARVAQAIEQAGVSEGAAIVQSRHTTAGVLINEHEPLLLEDLEAMFERLAPAAAVYAHDDFARRTVNMTPRERTNGHAHCRAAFLRTSEYIPISAGALTLGRWQRLFFVDFDAGQRREVWVTVMGR